MAFDAKKLTENLIAANKAASEAIKGMADGGSANLDRVFLTIPRVPEAKVLRAIHAARLNCSGKHKWIGMGYFITPSGVGQGDTRYTAVKIMTKHLQDAGWDAMTFYMTD